MVSGIDASSLGLVRKSPTRPDERFTAVEFDGTMVWALHPKYFTPDVLYELQQPYRSKGLSITNESEIYVQSVEVKGITSNSESTTITRPLIPIYAMENLVTNENPYDYSFYLSNFAMPTDPKEIIEKLFKDSVYSDEFRRLVATDANQQYMKELFGFAQGFAPWKLAYHASMFNEEDKANPLKEKIVKLSELPDMDLTSNENVTISVKGGVELSFPLQNMLSAGYDEIKIKWVEDHFSGFWYTVEFAGRTVQGNYSADYISAAFISEFSEHMARFGGREVMMIASDIWQSIFDFTSNFNWKSIVDADGKPIPIPGSDGEFQADRVFDKFGGTKSIGDTVFQFMLKGAQFSDMKKSNRNIGGEFVNDALNKQVDIMVDVSYPIAKKSTLSNGTSFEMGVFAANELHTFQVNSRFNGVDDLMSYLKTTFKGDIAKVNCELIFDYGRYSKYFNSLVQKGALLDG